MAFDQHSDAAEAVPQTEAAEADSAPKEALQVLGADVAEENKRPQTDTIL